LRQDIELMPQHREFGFELLSRLEAVAQHTDELESDCNHSAIMLSIGPGFRKRQRLTVVSKSHFALLQQW
jgi:hypothetical protein